MASYKVRRTALLQGGVQVGAAGNAASKIQFGLVSACVLAMTASAVGTAASMAIADAAVGDYIFIQPNVGDTGGVVCYAASVTDAGEVSASLVSSSGSAVAAYTGTFQYLLVG